jgi:hypothetical protein
VELLLRLPRAPPVRSSLTVSHRVRLALQVTVVQQATKHLRNALLARIKVQRAKQVVQPVPAARTLSLGRPNAGLVHPDTSVRQQMTSLSHARWEPTQQEEAQHAASVLLATCAREDPRQPHRRIPYARQVTIVSKLPPLFR